jgi:hypothetical protein
VPEVPEEVVPEKKRPVVPPKKPEAPPVTGMCQLNLTLQKKYPILKSKACLLLFISLSVKLLISFKCLKLLKKLFLKRKDQWCLLKSQKPHLSQVLSLTLGFIRSRSSALEIILVYWPS